MVRNTRLLLLAMSLAVVIAIAVGPSLAKPPEPTQPSGQPAQPNPGVMGPAAPTKNPNVTGKPPIPPPQPAQPQPTVQLKPGEIPQIEFDTPIYDFGRIKTGKDVEHDFWFHNNGNGPLEIISVKPS
jgi:hypothetical protein